MLQSVNKLLDKLIVHDFVSLDFVLVDFTELESAKPNVIIFHRGGRCRSLKGMRHVEVLA